MPAQSKQQQKFMGIVRAIQKGEQPASKFSKKAQDAADDMKKKDVEKFASTKHKVLPKKVEQALREKIRTMVEDYVETCGYRFSATNPEYKLKSPGGTGEEDRELKEEGFGGELSKTEKKKFNKERLENAEVLGYELTGKKDIKEAITGSTRKNLLKIGKEIKNNLFRINPGLKKVKDDRLLIRGLANTFMFMRYTPDNANYQNYKKYFPKNFKSSSVQKLANILQNEKDTVRKTFFKQIVKETKDLKEAVDEGDFISAIQSIQAGLDEAEYGFNDLGRLKGMSSSEKRIVKTLFSRFKVLMRGVEKARRVITRESINEDGHTDVPSAVRKLKTSIEDALQIIGHLKKVNDAEPLPSWWTDKVTLSANYLNSARNYILNPHESVFAVRQDKIKDDERYAKKPNFDYDPEKGKSRIKKVNETMKPSQIKKMRDEFKKTGDLPPHLKKLVKDLKIVKKKHKVKNIVVPGLEWMSDMKEQSVNEARLNPKETIKQLGGNRFLYMVGAKNLAVDKPRNELHMKIMRNAKGVSHVVIKLTSLDLYDMKFLSIRAGKVKVKATEKGVYGDQLATFFKKHTGLNTRL